MNRIEIVTTLAALLLGACDMVCPDCPECPLSDTNLLERVTACETARAKCKAGHQ